MTSPMAALSLDVGEAKRWVRSHLPTAGSLELFQVEPWAAVFRVPVDGAVAWFKACAQHQAFEVPLTASLSSRSSSVTEVLAHDTDHRWLLMADAGDPFRTLGNPPERWLEILPAYAELQIGETPRTDEHLSSGVPDLRVDRLAALAEELTRVELPLDEDGTVALRAYMPRFAGLCADLDGAGIAATVQHDDLHMNNVYVKDDVIRVLDWGDASISHPFFSLFETFRFLDELNHLPPDDPWFGRLRDAYLEPWGFEHRETFDLALRVSGLTHAIAWLRQRNTLPDGEKPGFDETFAVILRLALP